MRNNWYISIPGLLTGSVMAALLIILPFEIAVTIIFFSFFRWIICRILFTKFGLKLCHSSFGLDFSFFLSLGF